MPSSTVWRRRPEDLYYLRRTPDRPTAESIETLSPVDETSPFGRNSSQHDWHGYQSNGDFLTGLGLSYTAASDDDAGLEQAYDLYSSHSAEAHQWNVQSLTNGVHSERIGRARKEWYQTPGKAEQGLKRSRSKGHTRSGSTIDDLASAAIATSPSFADGSPSSTFAARPATSYVYSNHVFLSEERPAKRTRSEKIPSSEWPPREDRSITNHPIDAQRMRADAELLLGLRTACDFKHAHGSPATQETAFASSLNGINSNRELSSEGGHIDHSLVDFHMDKSSPIQSKVELIQDTSPIVKANIPNGLNASDLPKGNLPGHFPASTTVQSITSGENTIIDADSLMTEPVLSLQNVALPETTHTEEPKKPRRIKPEVQAEVCAACKHLQREVQADDEFTAISWIRCNPCDRWFHAACVGFKDKRETQAVDKFVCADCEPVHGPTTFVRKSSRARTAIDYAELNQGLVKSSAETSLHHYVQPIKEGKINFIPDTYPRIRPEYVTAEYFELTDGIKRPMVVPACWNPRFGHSESAAETAVPNVLASEEDVTMVDSSSTPNESDFVEEEVIDCDQDMLDMVMPRHLTVRKVAELYGLDESVAVIDVKSQQSSMKWNLQRWADYYESTGDKPVRNVISLEVSQSKLGRLIRRPKLVRDLDLQDLVWPSDSQTASNRKPVQFYCLMSVADSYTDFHIDFGGSSVYYHILKGKKTFFFIPPEDKNLKKYEDWCNSDTQETTFLGDLTGECCRVDLSEGDTMFIPAGWIHAVWTPEDSLVIGGNFLTQTDYEMQFKVVDVERNTGVEPKFRYPFFQKVMWYTLIKYLEEDPMPQDVLDDFYNDEEHVFLRANPVWHEFGDLENDAEPGDANHNCRFYSKAEIIGLPALRDYLYRTALIANDLPVVPIVTKETARKVKASIPKGHGEPLDLIKIFGIWCAWKTGNVKMPEWARPDAMTLQKLAEKREKLKKPEVFRTPPERVSMRKITQVHVEIPRRNSDGITTPTKGAALSAEVESDDGAKPQSSSKSSGLGPRRIACEPCRKRRIKCRHKEENQLAATAETPRPRSFSNVTIEAPKSSLSAVKNVDATRSPEQEYPDLPSDLAQAALATLDLQNSDGQPEMGNQSVSSSSKKGRSKACEECRKSKRRCVHDEFGRVDPAKAAEPSKPRGSASTKRPGRPSDEHQPSHAKRPRMETEGLDNSYSAASDSALYNDQDDQDVPIDPALLMETSLPAIDSDQPFLEDTPALMQSAADAIDPLLQEKAKTPPTRPTSGGGSVNAFERDDSAETYPIDPSLEQQEVAVALRTNAVKIETFSISIERLSRDGSADSLSSPPDSPADETEFFSAESDGMKPKTSVEANGDCSTSTTTHFHSPASTSRYSPRQPKQVDRYVPPEARPITKTPSKPVKGDRRASSSASGQTMATATGKSRRSSSNTSGTTHQLALNHQSGKIGSREASVRPGSRGSLGLNESDDADERFARELQAQENGLRRRASARA